MRSAPAGAGELLALVAIVCVGMAIRLSFFSGTVGDDDLRHAYAAYFLFSPDAEKHAVVNWGDDTPYRRMAVNVPVWLCLRAFGVHEWSLALTPLTFSLAGAVFMYLLLRLMAGPAAGLTAAAMWACLPVQVYQATLWLQDDIFAGTFAASLYFYIVALQSRGGRSLWYGLLSGLALGYLQYAKETAFLLVLPFGAAALLTVVRDRRTVWPAGAVVLGYVGLHALAGVLFWHLNGSFWWYWRETIEFSREKAAVNRAVAEVLALIWQRCVEKWLFGYAVVLFPLLAGCCFFSRRAPHRLLLALLLGVQLFVWYGATRMTVWQDRYAEQMSVPYVVITVLGSAILGQHIVGAKRERQWLVWLAMCGLVVATAAGLRRDVQQFRYGRTAHLRTSLAYFEAMAGPQETIYTFEPPERSISYTRRTLYQFAGFQAPGGGFRTWRPGETPTSGWAIMSYLESRFGAENLPIPDNWLLEFEGGMSAKRTRSGLWARVYRIVPESVATPKLDTLWQWPRDSHIRVAADGVGVPPDSMPSQPAGALEVPVRKSPCLVRFEDAAAATAALKHGTWIPPNQRELRFHVRVRTTGAPRFEVGLVRLPISADGSAGGRQVLYFRSVAVERTATQLLHTATAACPTGEYVTPMLRVYDAAGGSFEILDAQLQSMGL